MSAVGWFPFEIWNNIWRAGWVGASGNIQEGGGNEVKYVSPIPATLLSHDDDKTEIYDDHGGGHGFGNSQVLVHKTYSESLLLGEP